jgi:hypothetical protein
MLEIFENITLEIIFQKKKNSYEDQKIVAFGFIRLAIQLTTVKMGCATADDYFRPKFITLHSTYT